jgi:hypothetical protein
MLEPSNTYNLTHLTYEELEARLVAHCEPIDVTRVLDAYEMARNVHEYQRRNDGTPYFFHASRTVKILMDELHVYDSDVLIASLLQDVLEDSDAISRTVLDYNFGRQGTRREVAQCKCGLCVDQVGVTSGQHPLPVLQPQAQSTTVPLHHVRTVHAHSGHK